MFEHVEGCTMCLQLGLQHYTLPDGRVMHCYHPRRQLVDEVQVQDDMPEGSPLTLKVFTHSCVSCYLASYGC
jgi:SUMO ligase MMS21 Smc5/6 complex component